MSRALNSWVRWRSSKVYIPKQSVELCLLGAMKHGREILLAVMFALVGRTISYVATLY